jgi:hypothetical protein
MNINKQIQDKLNYLYSERDKIESTGFRIDPDVKKVYRFINEEIQILQLMLLKSQYKQFCCYLHELRDDSIETTTKANPHVV